MSTTTKITVTTTIKTPIDKVWQYFTTPQHITQWNAANNDWHTPQAENDLRPGGKFSYRMEAKDGSFGFDFWGIYTEVVTNEKIAYTMGDDRKVEILFAETADGVTVTETFETEDTNSAELQRSGWQAILDNFKQYTEGK